MSEEARYAHTGVHVKAHIETSEAAAALSLEDITLADVIPGQYEGGAALATGSNDKLVPHYSISYKCYMLQVAFPDIALCLQALSYGKGRKI